MRIGLILQPISRFQYVEVHVDFATFSAIDIAMVGAFTATMIYRGSNSLGQKIGKLFAFCLVGTMMAQGQSFIPKDNNQLDLASGLSWIGGAAPGSIDIGLWDSTVTGPNTTSLGWNLSWGGISVLNPGGEVTINGPYSLTIGSQGIHVAASEVLTISAQLYGNLSKSGGGVLNIIGEATSSSELSIDSGIFVLTGTLSADATVSSMATLRGTGRLNGNLTMDGLALLGDGSSGALTVEGGIQLSNSSSIAATIGATSGQLQGEGATIILAGNLHFDLEAGYSPGDSWQILNGFSDHIGNFDSVSMTGEQSGFFVFDSLTDTWSATFDDTTFEFSQETGVLSVVPEPSSVAMLFLSGFAIFFGIRKRR